MIILIVEQKVSSIEYDFKQHYNRESAPTGVENGSAGVDSTKNGDVGEIQLEV